VPSPRNARRTGPQAKYIAAHAISAALSPRRETVLDVQKNGSGISTVTFAAARTAPVFALRSANWLRGRRPPRHRQRGSYRCHACWGLAHLRRQAPELSLGLVRSPNWLYRQKITIDHTGRRGPRGLPGACHRCGRAGGHVHPCPLRCDPHVRSDATIENSRPGVAGASCSTTARACSLPTARVAQMSDSLPIDLNQLPLRSDAT
jgi:hypothetical protein